MRFEYTDGCNKDFIKLCHGLDDFLNELVGGEENRSGYIQYNKLDDIHDVVIAYDKDVAVGGAGFKRYDDENAEVKRVFVKKEYRGRGISVTLMKMLEERAREKGFKHFILESGEPLVAAMSLYRKIGYKVIPNYGQYVDMKESICMKKTLEMDRKTTAMKKVKRKSIGTHFSMCVQPAFIIGTNNEDGSYNFAPITWVSITNERDNDYLLTISMFGTKMTKQNVLRTGMLSVNLVSTDMLELMDYFGTHCAKDGKKDAISYGVCRGDVVDVPVLEESRWVYECEVAQFVETGDSTTFFCRIKNIQIDERMECTDTFDIDLTKLDPVIYSGMYHSIGTLLGKIGDFSK